MERNNDHMRNTSHKLMNLNVEIEKKTKLVNGNYENCIKMKRMLKSNEFTWIKLN